MMEDEVDGACETDGENRGSLGKCEGKRQHGRLVLWNGRFMLTLISKKKYGAAGVGCWCGLLVWAAGVGC
jgi:hypothetical protein